MRWHIPHLARSFSTVFKSLESSRLSKTAIHIDSRRLELYSHETKKYITAISHIKCLHVYFSFSFFSFTFLIFSQTRFAESWMTVTWKWCIVCYVIQKTDGVREYSEIIDKNVIHLRNSKQLLLTIDMSSFNSATSAFFSFNDFFSASSSVPSSSNEPLPPLSELLPGS